MIKETKNNIDDLIPEGWEFREEYMNSALDGLRKQQLVTKWKKAAWWSGAAASFIAVASSLLYVCNLSPSHQAQIRTEQNQQDNHSSSTAVEVTTGSSSHSESIADETPQNSGNKLNDNTSDNSTLEVPAAPNNNPAARSNGIKPIEQNTAASPGAKKQNMKRNKIQNKLIQSVPSPFVAPTSQSNDVTDSGGSNEPAPKIQGDDKNSSTKLIGSDNEETAPNGVIQTSIQEERLNFNPSETMGGLKGNFSLPIFPLLSSNTMGPGSKHAWFLWAGNTAWADYGRTTNRLDFQPLFGIAHRYRLNERWSLQSHINYSSIQDPGAVYQQVQTIYDYQQLQSTTSVVTKRLHYGTLASAMQYKISPQWQLYAGFVGSLKITGTNTLHRTDWNNESQSENARGYVHGFQRLNYGVQFGFNRQLNRKWSVGIQAIAGLTDISKNNVFNEGIRQTNSQLNLLIGYRIK